VFPRLALDARPNSARPLQTASADDGPPPARARGASARVSTLCQSPYEPSQRRWCVIPAALLWHSGGSLATSQRTAITHCIERHRARYSHLLSYEPMIANKHHGPGPVVCSCTIRTYKRSLALLRLRALHTAIHYTEHTTCIPYSTLSFCFAKARGATY